MLSRCISEATKLISSSEGVIKPLKRSESTMIISDGLKAGEEIALQDPDAKPSDRKKGGKGEGGGGGGSMPMGMGRKG